jgi:hypothetical protein
VGEPFIAQMQALPLVQAFAFWCRCSAAAKALQQARRPVTLPARAVVCAQAVQFTHLHRNHGPVGAVSGFDHSALDAAQAGWADNTFSYPLWQYEFKPVSSRIAVFTMDFAAAAPRPGRPWTDRQSARVFGGDAASPAARWNSTPCGKLYRCGGMAALAAFGAEVSPAAAGTAGNAANAVIVWLELQLDPAGQFVVTTHPASAPYARQTVRFFERPVLIPRADDLPAAAAGGQAPYVCVYVDEAGGGVEMEIGCS